jgi:hypothetical protein
MRSFRPQGTPRILGISDGSGIFVDNKGNIVAIFLSPEKRLIAG